MLSRKPVGSPESGSDGDGGAPHHLVSFGNRIVECRAIQRVPLADRWKSEMVDAVRATRWANPAPIANAAAPAVLPGPAELPPAPPARGYESKSVCIRAEDLRKYGRTAGCRRCTLMTNGESARGIAHTRACRDRFEQAMIEANDERVQAAIDRRDRHRSGQVEPLAEQPVHAPVAAPVAHPADDAQPEGGAA